MIDVRATSGLQATRSGAGVANREHRVLEPSRGNSRASADPDHAPGVDDHGAEIRTSRVQKAPGGLRVHPHPPAEQPREKHRGRVVAGEERIELDPHDQLGAGSHARSASRGGRGRRGRWRRGGPFVVGRVVVGGGARVRGDQAVAVASTVQGRVEERDQPGESPSAGVRPVVDRGPVVIARCWVVPFGDVVRGRRAVECRVQDRPVLGRHLPEQLASEAVEAWLHRQEPTRGVVGPGGRRRVERRKRLTDGEQHRVGVMVTSDLDDPCDRGVDGVVEVGRKPLAHQRDGPDLCPRQPAAAESGVKGREPTADLRSGPEHPSVRRRAPRDDRQPVVDADTGHGLYPAISLEFDHQVDGACEQGIGVTQQGEHGPQSRDLVEDRGPIRLEQAWRDTFVRRVLHAVTSLLATSGSRDAEHMFGMAV